MHLKKEYIKRIDSFLERLGCEYVDIRYEMVDHLASEIEQNVNDYDDFFRKNKMKGKFLGFMLRKKDELYKNYLKQSKKLFWLNFKHIFKLIFNELQNIKVLMFVVLTIIVFKYISTISLRYSAIFAIILASLSVIAFSYLQNKEVKKYGKLRLLHTFYVLSYFPYFIIVNPFTNMYKLIKHENNDYLVMIFYVAYFIFNVLLTIVFIKDREQFKKKHRMIIQ